jgi:uncharacterized RDD family membrane protein YckC
MNCPKCHNSEIDSTGLCLVCGCPAIVTEAPGPPEAAGDLEHAPLSEAEEPIGEVPPRQAELPEWRLELSRRLQEIKLKRGAFETGQVPADAAAGAEAVETQEPVFEEPEPAPPKPASPRKSRRAARGAGPDPSPATATAAASGQMTASPADQNEPEPQVSRQTATAFSAADMVIRPSVEEVVIRHQQNTQDLIDAVMSKLEMQKQLTASVPAQESELPPKAEPKFVPVAETGPDTSPEPDPVAKDESKPEPKAVLNPVPVTRAEPKHEPKTDPNLAPKAELKQGPEPRLEREQVLEPDRGIHASELIVARPPDDKLILLSRTLAGLVDLIIVVVCASLMILAVDILEGIDLFDAVSKIHYALLFLLMYFVYSFFFLGMASQTIGMMLTDLRIVGASAGKPGAIQIGVRCLIFLLGVGMLGAGLLWGCFDRRSRCFHDLLSRTLVVKVAS